MDHLESGQRQKKMRLFRIVSGLLFGVALWQAPAAAQDQMADPTIAELLPGQVLEYTAEFFGRYRPESALDMVRQVPGFQLDDGDRSRGYSAAAGNILINGRRPGAKEDLPSAILGRIPAAHVERRAVEDIYDAAGLLTERRRDNSTENGYKAGTSLNASAWRGDTRLQVNTSLFLGKELEPRVSLRVPEAGGTGPREEHYDAVRRDRSFEAGVNAERGLSDDLLAKAILLHIYGDNDQLLTQTSYNPAGGVTQYRTADREAVGTEGIARLEFDWSGLPDHAIQFNLEGAYNSLDGALVQLVDTGAGAVVVDFPGSDVLVEEVRGDFLLKDTWYVGYLELDYGLGAEVSRLTQSGGAEQSRRFFFLKPHAIISYTGPGRGQTRLRMAREVSQLDFEDFISAMVFEYDDLALGNPDLRPDTTWVAELTRESRFGRESVIKLTLFHHWISDVLDLLPLSETFEAPGNIGDGRCWGLRLEGAVPLEWLGLTGARLDVQARWQASTVTDPVTRRERGLSGGSGFGGTPEITRDDENRYALVLDYRQDLEAARVAWGLTWACARSAPCTRSRSWTSTMKIPRSMPLSRPPAGWASNCACWGKT